MDKHKAAQDQPDFDLEAEESEAARPVAARRPSALTAVVGAVLDAAVPPLVRRRLHHAKALCVAIQVPSTAWVAPVAAHFRKQFGSRWVTEARDGSIRLAHQSSVGSSKISQALSQGHCAVGVAADQNILPQALIAAADITIRLTIPTGPVLRTAITRFGGVPPRRWTTGSRPASTLTISSQRSGPAPAHIASSIDWPQRHRRFAASGAEACRYTGGRRRVRPRSHLGPSACQGRCRRGQLAGASKRNSAP